MSKISDEIRKKERELEELKRKAELEESRDKYIKPLEEYTVEEKVKFFDSTYKSSLSELKQKESGDYCEDNDNAHYTWEACMEILGRDSRKFWDYFNSLD
jgi:hypothetical protein